MGITLTVHFEDPFWVGFFEREDCEGYAVARVVFGAEPSNVEVHAFVLSRCLGLDFARVGEVRVAAKERLSPKRAQRLAAQLMRRSASSTRAQEALRAAMDTRKEASREGSRSRVQALRDRRRLLRVAKQKRRHRGR